MNQRRRFVVVGGGISGLSAAYRLRQLCLQLPDPPEVLLIEGSPRLGGCISSYSLDNTTFELGPDSFITDKPAALELCRKLGIENRLIEPDQNYRRSLVAYKGKLYPVPEGFMLMAPTQILPVLSSPLFSFEGKLRMMQEPFVKPLASDADETLQEFTERRLGREVFERLVQPLVGGIYTADPSKLSFKAALPRLAMLEQKYGSLTKGLSVTKRKTAKKESGARYGLFVTFDDGMNVLVDALSSALPENSVRTHRLVSRVKRNEQGAGWNVHCSDGQVIPADGVVIATTSYHAADMVSDLDKSLSAELKNIEYSSSAVLNLIYRRSDVPHALDAFGFVVPAIERKTILACSFTSVKWPGRTQEDKVLLRVFIGGALQPDVYDLADEQIECLMWEDLRTYLGIRAVPLMSVISRYHKAMPQYNVGHVQRVANIEKALSLLPGLALAGNAYKGVGIPDCIASGENAAEAVFLNLSQIKMSSPTSAV